MLMVDPKFIKELHKTLQNELLPDAKPVLPLGMIDDIINGATPNRLWAREKASKFLTALRKQTSEKPPSS